MNFEYVLNNVKKKASIIKYFKLKNNIEYILYHDVDDTEEIKTVYLSKLIDNNGKITFEKPDTSELQLIQQVIKKLIEKDTKYEDLFEFGYLNFNYNKCEGRDIQSNGSQMIKLDNEKYSNMSKIIKEKIDLKTPIISILIFVIIYATILIILPFIDSTIYNKKVQKPSENKYIINCKQVEEEGLKKIESDGYGNLLFLTEKGNLYSNNEEDDLECNIIEQALDYSSYSVDNMEKLTNIRSISYSGFDIFYVLFDDGSTTIYKKLDNVFYIYDDDGLKKFDFKNVNDFLEFKNQIYYIKDNSLYDANNTKVVDSSKFNSNVEFIGYYDDYSSSILYLKDDKYIYTYDISNYEIKSLSEFNGYHSNDIISMQKGYYSTKIYTVNNNLVEISNNQHEVITIFTFIKGIISIKLYYIVLIFALVIVFGLIAYFNQKGYKKELLTFGKLYIGIRFLLSIISGGFSLKSIIDLVISYLVIFNILYLIKKLIAFILRKINIENVFVYLIFYLLTFILLAYSALEIFNIYKIW